MDKVVLCMVFEANLECGTTVTRKFGVVLEACL